MLLSTLRAQPLDPCLTCIIVAHLQLRLMQQAVQPATCIVMHAAKERSAGEASTSGQSEQTLVNLRNGQSLFIWGPRSALQPQGSLEWPLWLHPRAPGVLTFHCVWYYEPVAPVEGMKFRSEKALGRCTTGHPAIPCADALVGLLLGAGLPLD